MHPEGPAIGQFSQFFSMDFLGPGTNAELVPKFHVVLHASHAVILVSI
jgi:hypothetical protein